MQVGEGYIVPDPMRGNINKALVSKLAKGLAVGGAVLGTTLGAMSIENRLREAQREAELNRRLVDSRTQTDLIVDIECLEV